MVEIASQTCSIEEVGQMKLINDNKATFHIASDPTFHKRTKHIKIDCHFIRENIISRYMLKIDCHFIEEKIISRCMLSR